MSIHYSDTLYSNTSMLVIAKSIGKTTLAAQIFFTQILVKENPNLYTFINVSEQVAHSQSIQ